jgi:hypothetical protein
VLDQGHRDPAALTELMLEAGGPLAQWARPTRSASVRPNDDFLKALAPRYCNMRKTTIMRLERDQRNIIARHALGLRTAMNSIPAKNNGCSPPRSSALSSATMRSRPAAGSWLARRIQPGRLADDGGARPPRPATSCRIWRFGGGAMDTVSLMEAIGAALIVEPLATVRWVPIHRPRPEQ